MTKRVILLSILYYNWTLLFMLLLLLFGSFFVVSRAFVLSSPKNKWSHHPYNPRPVYFAKSKKNAKDDESSNNNNNNDNININNNKDTSSSSAKEENDQEFDFDFVGDFENDDDGDYYSWMDQDEKMYSMFGGEDDFMAEGPDAFLSVDDLSLLHNISIPTLIGEDNDGDDINSGGGGDGSSTAKRKKNNTIISLEDLKKLSSSGLSYFYLRDEIGLSEDAMWKITNRAGSILGMKASTIREKINVLQNTMQLSDDDVRQLIGAQPSLLHLSAKKNLAPTILFLVRQLGVGVQELRTLVLECPSVLTYSIPNLNKKIEFFIDLLGCSVKECREILLEVPTLMTCGVDTGLMPRFQFLHKEIKIPIPKLRKIIQKNPRILQMSVDDNLQPKLIFYMIMTLHMEPAEVQRVLLKCPNILNYNLEDHILPITRYILSLDFSAHELARMCLKFPQILTYSLPKLKHVVGYLRFELGLEASGVRRVLYQAPQIVSLSMDNLSSKVAFLKDAVGANDDDTATLQKVIVGMPTLLYLSIESNLGPKVSYLREQLGEEDFCPALARMPALLAYSLDKRIKPRMERIAESGVDLSSITIGISMKEEAFEDWLRGRATKAAKMAGLGIVTEGVSTTRNNASDGALGGPSATTKDKEEGNGEEAEDGKVVQDGGRIVHWVRRN